MNGRWKEGGLMIELFKPTKTSMKFDRMIPSGSSWLMGIKTQRLVGQAHAVIKPGKSIPIWRFHQMTGHTGEYLMKTTADYTATKTYPKFVFFTLKKIKGFHTLIKKPSTSEKNLGFHPK